MTYFWTMENKNEACSYELEAIVSFDDRGQLVIPKDLRKKFNLKAGHKFALISCIKSGCSDCGCQESEAEICCFTLVSTNQIKAMLPNIVGHSLPTS